MLNNSKEQIKFMEWFEKQPIGNIENAWRLSAKLHLGANNLLIYLKTLEANKRVKIVRTKNNRWIYFKLK